MSLECVFTREALVAVVAGERFHRKVDPLVSLQVMVTIEALRALITFEWSIMRRRLLWRVRPWVAVHRMRVGSIAAIEPHG